MTEAAERRSAFTRLSELVQAVEKEPGSRAKT